MSRKVKATKALSERIRVLMYNVGFGDAFLVFIPTRDGERRILIDCGSLASAGYPISRIVSDILAKVSDDDGNARIDLVVATHRHRDHISGFADRRWKNVAVGEVWMPWTEDPRDPAATAIRARQARLAAGLAASLANTKRMDAATGREMKRLQDLVALALGNDAAMEMLHKGFAGRPMRHYLPDQAGRNVIRTDVLPGIDVHILGPSRDKSVIRDLNPPRGESYLRAAALSGQSQDALEPFQPQWRVKKGDFGKELAWKHLRLSKNDQDAIKATGAAIDPMLTVALNSALNGTSLVMVFRVKDAVLLFPGDAQWGTWRVAGGCPRFC